MQQLSLRHRLPRPYSDFGPNKFFRIQPLRLLFGKRETHYLFQDKCQVLAFQDHQRIPLTYYRRNADQYEE